MYKAVEIIPKSSSSRLVSADEISTRFHGDVPKMIHFACPYCNRPVNAVAMGVRKRSMARVKSPYFGHYPGDPWTHACPEYHRGSVSVQFHKSPVLPMFLRRHSGKEFEIGVSIHPHPTRPYRLGDGSAMINGRAYFPKHEDRLRYTKVVLDSPDAALSDVHVPEALGRAIGYTESGNSILVFSDIYGAGGGRRIGKETALHPGRTYYIVAKPSIMRGATDCFDSLEEVGSIRGNGELAVWRVSVDRMSVRRDDANRWLYQYGYALSEVDMMAHPVWPPTLRSSGVDEPLFRMSDVVYKTPYMADDSGADTDRPRNIGYNASLRTGMRAVGFIGMECGTVAQKELEGDCLFIRPSRFQAWNALLVSRTPARGHDPFPTERIMAATRRPAASTVKRAGTYGLTVRADADLGKYEKPRFGHYSRASVCAILRDPKGKLYELRRIMDYIGNNEFHWVFPGPADNRSFRYGRPFPQGFGHPLQAGRINVDDVDCDFVFLRWSPRPRNGDSMLVDTEPGSLRKHPMFYEVVDVSWHSQDSSPLQWLCRGITYDGAPTDKVLVRYRRGENDRSDAILLDKNNLDIGCGTLRLGASAADTAPGFVIDDSKVHTAPRIGITGNVRRLIYTSSDLGETTGTVRIGRRARETACTVEAADDSPDKEFVIRQGKTEDELVSMIVQTIKDNLVSQGFRSRIESEDGVDMLAKGLAATIAVCRILVVPACFAERIADALAFTRDRMDATEMQDLKYMFDNASPRRTYLVDGGRNAVPVNGGRLSHMAQERRGLFVVPVEGIDVGTRRDAAFWNKAFLIPTDNIAIKGKPDGCQLILSTDVKIPDDAPSPKKTHALAGRLSELIGGRLSGKALEFTSDVLSRRIPYGNGAGEWIWRQLVCQTFAALGAEQAIEASRSLNRETAGRTLVEILKEAHHAGQTH